MQPDWFPNGTAECIIVGVNTSRLATAIGLVALSALGIWYSNKTPPVVGAEVTDRFSAERAFGHVQQLAQRPHPPGTPDHARVREYLLAELRRIGLTPEVQTTTGVGTRYAVAGRVHNVLARIPGTSPGGPAVLLMAHYDGVWAGPSTADDAAATAALLDVAGILKAERHTHDVILLIADGEEAGLLGAAAFAREHPWARDVAVTLNFEARGVHGVSRMFETGPGNLDVARELRKVPGVRATSLSVTVYRLLPNDTDLSEMAVLEKPAMNFAFIGGVQRYHTAEDDPAHLSLGSMQHHGEQALALARAFAAGPLPRPQTGDAAFFDFPLLGLIVYPIGWSLAIALIVLVVVVAAIVLGGKREERWGRGVLIGAATFVAALIVALFLNLCLSFGVSRLHAGAIGGASEWSAIYAAAYAFVCVAVVLAAWMSARRFAGAASLQLGGLAVLAAITLALAIKVAGVSFLFAWPLLFAGIAALLAAMGRAVASRIAAWVAAAVALIMLVPTIHAMVVVALGLDQTGTALLSILAVVALWLVALLLDALGAPGTLRPAIGTGALAVILLLVGAATVRTNARNPAGSTFAYVIDSDSLRGWLAGSGTTAGVRHWVRREFNVETPDARVPAWLLRSFEARRIKPAPVGAFVAPTVTLLSDSATATGRVVTLRVRPDTGTLSVSISADSGIAAAAVDGRAIDRSRYRGRATRWTLEYVAPPDSGFTLRLQLAGAIAPSLSILARRPGIPQLTGLTVPARPAGVLPIQAGDQSIVFKRVQL
jgi:hypothetical protein